MAWVIAHFTLPQSDFGFHGHSRPQAMIVVFALLQHNAHRHTLHNLYVIARRIFRRQQTESRTRGAAEGINVTAVVAS